MISFAIANCCGVLSDATVGTRVLNRDRFDAVLRRAIAGHDFTTGKVAGQAVLPLGAEAVPTVSCGVGRTSPQRQDYCGRRHREAVGAFLRRDLAVAADSVSAVVYTKDAYLQDPDVLQEPEELERIANLDVTHVLVAVLAAVGPKPPLGVERLLRNLAGGNREALVWDTATIRQQLTASVEYAREWCTVADSDDTVSNAAVDDALARHELACKFAAELANQAGDTDELRACARQFVATLPG